MKAGYERLQRARTLVLLVSVIVGCCGVIRFAGAEDPDGEPILARFETMVRANLDNPNVLPSAEIDSLMAAIAARPLGDRIAFWADFFYRDARARYVFGLDPDGYVSEGRLCDDFRTDCVLFLYRTTELGRSSSAREAVQFAFGTRFYGAGVEDAILPDGRVRYDHPSHHDYSEDIFRSGIWGKDVTPRIGPIRSDPGNERFPAGTISYVPKDQLNYTAFQPGDLVYFVLDENTPKGSEERAKGTLIQHLGIVTREGAEVYLIHAAKQPLTGYYDGGKIEKVPLRTYLERVGVFKGILVSRIEEF
jgi:hypothetical protein